MSGDPKARGIGWTIALLLIGVAVLFVALVFVAARWIDLSSVKYGNAFTGVAAFFSALAFAVFLIALWLQKEELALQRKELEQTRAELKGQKEQLEAQNRTLTQQRFENTFFQLLSLYEKTAQTMPPDLAMRRSSFQRHFGSLGGTYTDTQRRGNIADGEQLIETVYREVDKNFPHELAGYFDTVHHLLKLVETSSVEDKSFYAGILRAQLSKYELLLLFYHCLMPENKKFKSRIEKFGVFRYLHQHELLDRKHGSIGTPHDKLYLDSAFGN